MLLCLSLYFADCKYFYVRVYCCSFVFCCLDYSEPCSWQHSLGQGKEYMPAVLYYLKLFSNVYLYRYVRFACTA